MKPHILPPTPCCFHMSAVSFSVPLLFDHIQVSLFLRVKDVQRPKVNSDGLHWRRCIFSFFPSTNLFSTFYAFADRGSQGSLDLTELIGVPLPPSVSFVTGFEGYPAYSFGPDANVGRLTKSFIPDPFYHDFAITVTAKPTTRHGGMLFAITDAYQKVSERDCI